MTAYLDEAARRGVAAVDRVLLVGGSSRMPAVADLLRRELALDPQLHDPELAVARGAALYGEKTELSRMVAADLRSRGRLRDGVPLDDAVPADLDGACRRVADAIAVSQAQVRRAGRRGGRSGCGRGRTVRAGRRPPAARRPGRPGPPVPGGVARRTAAGGR